MALIWSVSYICSPLALHKRSWRECCNDAQGLGAAGVVFVVDDFAAWLVGMLADASLKKLTTLVFGSDQDRALRQAAVAAAQQALAAAGLLDNSHVNRTRFGIYLGSGEGIQDFHNLLSLIAQAYDPAKRSVDTGVFNRGGIQAFHPGPEAEQARQLLRRARGEVAKWN